MGQNSFAPSDDGGEEEEGADHGSDEAIEKAREETISRAEDYIKNADVSEGADEDGYFELYNTETGEYTVFSGSDAGQPSNTGFKFHIGRPGENEILLVTAHSHPKEKGRPDIDRDNENINKNRGDKRLRRYAPVVLKTPSGRVRVFPSPFGYRDIREAR